MNSKTHLSLPVKSAKLFIVCCLVHFYGSLLYSGIPCLEPGDTLQDKTYNSSFKTVMLYKDGWELSYPIINLGSGEKLRLAFDELTRIRQEYHFIIKHCSAEWIEDNLESYEFMDNPTDNRITRYEYSFSTYVPYIHYELVFPASDWEFHKSGNYIVLIYGLDPLQPLLTKRFMVSENRIAMNVEMRKPGAGASVENSQAFDIFLTMPADDNERLSENPVINVMQNGDWNSLKSNVNLLLSGGTNLEYRLDGKDAFQGINEFRNFDIKSVKYQSPRIQNITFSTNVFHIGLYPDKSRSYSDYFFDNDLNGKYYIKVQEGINSSTDADYVYVYFTFPMYQPVTDGEIYISGALCNWTLSDENRLKYNYDTHAYEHTLLLKQGYYNYIYTFLKKGKKEPDYAYIEGSHFETENDYLVMAYQKDSRGLDRLIGVRIFNTLNKK